MIKIEISKKLQGTSAQIDFRVKCEFKNGEFWTIFGESGIGKTTFLRMIAGLENPDAGYIEIDDEVWFDSDKNINLPPQQRRVGFVFQNYALFENMSVIENIYFAQRVKDEKKAKSILEKIGITKLKNRKPSTLSGGQRQRVALCRAIALEPKILLLDEPLSALDSLTRLKLQDELKNIHDKFHLTTLLVSHDRSEVFKLSDYVVWLKDGKIFKKGSPKEIFLPKDSSRKFSFTGEILSLEKRDILVVATIGIGQNIVEVVLDTEEAKDFIVGCEVVVATKAFNPLVKKI